MSNSRKYSLAICLLVIMVFVTGYGNSGGGSASVAGEIYLEDITVPAGFDFSNTKTVDITITAAEHGLSKDAFIKIALDQGYTHTLYLGRLDHIGGLTMQFTVPGKTTKLYYKVYEADIEPSEGEVTL